MSGGGVGGGVASGSRSWRRSRTTAPSWRRWSGQASGPPNLSPDAVNVPMIRHWVEAMGDENPVYVSDEAARAAGLRRA